MLNKLKCFKIIDYCHSFEVGIADSIASFEYQNI